MKRQTSSLRDSTLEDLPLDRLRPSVMLSYRQRIIPLSRLLGQSIAPPCLFPAPISRIVDHAHLLPTAFLRAYPTPLIEPAHRLASPSWRKLEGHGHYPTPSAGRKMLRHRACQARQKKQTYSSQDRVLRSRTKVKWTQWMRTRMRVHRPNRHAKLWANDVSSKMLTVGLCSSRRRLAADTQTTSIPTTYLVCPNDPHPTAHTNPSTQNTSTTLCR